MCGRIFIRPEAKNQSLLHRLGLEHFTLPDAPNIAPTEAVPVIHYLDGQLTISPMRWWLVPGWSDGPNTKYAMFNARIESVETSRAYKGPLKYRRGIVPATGFVEWKTEQGKKQPYYSEGETAPLALAAIWEIWQEELLSVSILTQPANSEFEQYHHRMPVVLHDGLVDTWLDHSLSGPEAKEAVSGAAILLETRAVDPRINSGREKVWPQKL